MSELQKAWQVCPKVPPSHAARFADLHPVVLQVLYNRGLTLPAEVAEFLEPTGATGDPFALQDMPAAVERLRRALRDEDQIVVYGDFDVDGVTSAALLVQTLEALGGHVTPHIPHRVDDGYGLRTDTLDRLARAGARLVVTTDCGVRSIGEVAHANQLGLDVIVTDHHSVGSELPPAVAVLDPKRPGGSYPFDELAGVGVAFRLAQALLESHRADPISPNAVGLEEHELLDLVALGTVADMVPLRSENRVLVMRGLEALRQSDRPGIAALVDQVRLRPAQVDARAISFALGPRLNAAGRMGHASLAYDLLVTKYPGELKQLVQQLDALNRERQLVTSQALERARCAILAAPSADALVFVDDPDFKVGVIGLVAGRLVEEYSRPAVVVQRGDGFSRGSARSVDDFSIIAALDACAPLLGQYGGHAAAAGFTVTTDNLDALAQQLRGLAADALGERPARPAVSVDAEIALQEMSWDLQRQISRLEPFGYGNPAPTFLSRNVRLTQQRTCGSENQHLKLALNDGQVTWDGIAFRQGDWAGKLPDRVDIVFQLEVNEWRNEQRLQLNIQDLQPTQAERPGRLVSARPDATPSDVQCAS